MSELPKGWEISTLDDIANVVTGNTPKKNGSNYGGEYAYYKPADLDAGYHIKSTSDTLTDEGMANARFIPANSTLVTCIGATIGKTGLSHTDGSCNQQINALVPMEGINKSWLYFMMCSPNMQSKIKANASSTTLPILNKSKFSVLPISVAPLAEQNRIVEKLDEVLAQVDTIKARLDGIPNLLKRFRQSVLASAVSGKLTEEWRGVTDSYKTVIVNDICDMAFDGPFGSKLKSNDYTQIGCRVVRLENIGHLHFLESKKTYVSESKFDSLPKNHLAEGDILFSSFVDEEIRVCLFPGLETGTINKADCFCLRVNSEIALNKYVCYLLASLPTYLKIKKAVHGATRPRINLRFLKNFELELPDLAEQKEIVRLVDQYFAFADTIEAQVKKAQVRVDNLTQSILAKAFRGELVAQDPNDEPADKLLERIAEARKEAETLAKAAKKARSTKSPAKKRAAKNA